MAFTHALSTNNYGPAKIIVSSSSANGTHTTITSALADASSGDTIFVRTGTYTEDFLLKAGVNITAFDDGNTPNVTVIGKMTFTALGLVTLSGIRFQTNSDNILAMSGSNGSTLLFQNCTLIVTNNVVGISFSNSNVDAIIEFYNCEGDISDTSSQLFVSTSTGEIIFNDTLITNGQLNANHSTTASTISAGSIKVFCSFLDTEITSSGTASMIVDKSTFASNLSTTGHNATRLTFGGSGTNALYTSRVESGTSSAVTISAATTISEAIVNSSNANAISGASALTATNMNFTGSSSTIAPTITPLVTNLGTLRLTTPLEQSYGGSGQNNFSGNLVLINSQTVAGSSAVTFTSGISSTYDDYVIRVKGLSGSGATFLYSQVSSDGGATWANTGYNNNGAFAHSGGTGTFYVGGQAQMRITDNIPSAANNQMAGVIEYFDISSGSFMPVCLSRIQAIGAINNMTYYGNAYGTAIAVNALKLYPDAGTISGTFILFGVVK